MNKTSLNILHAAANGYTVDELGNVFSKNKKLSLYKDSGGYLCFSVFRLGASDMLPVHRFQAYIKFGESVFHAEVVRHHDGNRTNNSWDNILLGTQQENSMDRLPADRIAQAVYAANHIRKFSDLEMQDIREYHREVKSYKKTMEKFGISSKSTTHRILNVDYVTNK